MSSRHSSGATRRPGQGDPTGQRLGRPGQPVECRRAVLGARDEAQCLGGRLTVGRRRGQPVLFRLEPGVLVGVLDGGTVDLVHLVPEEVGLAGP